MEAADIRETPSEAPGFWLRLLGVLSLVGAGFTFLVDGWTDTNALGRQLAWAGITLSLCFAGIWAVRRFRDSAGARVALALAAATIPLHFAQLGSAIWDLRQSGALVSAGAVLGCGAIVLALGPVLSLGGAALVRRWAIPFTLLLFAFSAPLLVPSRDGDVIAALGLAELAVILGLELGVVPRREELRSLEAVSARLLLVVPLSILLVRNAFHEVSDALLSTMLLAPGALLLACPRTLFAERDAPVPALMQWTGVVALLLAATVEFPFRTAYPAAMAAVALAGFYLMPRNVASWVLGFLGTGALVLGVGANWGEPSYALSIVMVLLAAGFSLVAYRNRALVWCVANLVCLVAALASQAALLVRWPVHYAWLAPALAGLALLLLGSSIQAPNSRARRLWTAVRLHFGENA